MSYPTYSWLRILRRKYPQVTPKQFEGRINGTTTRLIDSYIQELFTNGYIENIKDSEDTNRRLFELIENRLRFEHGHFIDVIHFNKSILKIIIS